MSDFDHLYSIFALMSLFFGYIFRVFRWHFLLSISGSNILISKCIAPFMGSIALNNILPLRAGDIFRAVIFPRYIGIRKSVSTSSILIERIFDLITLLIFILIGFSLKIIGDFILGAKIIAFGSFILSIIALMVVSSCSKFLADHMLQFINNKRIPKSNFKYKLIIMIIDLLNSLDHMSKPSVLFITGILSFLIWISEAGVFYILMLGFNFDSSIEIALVIMSIATLSTFLPSTPGYIGPFHLAVFTAISFFGYSSDLSASYAILSHLLIWLPTTIVGVSVILFNPRLFKFNKEQKFIS